MEVELRPVNFDPFKTPDIPSLVVSIAREHGVDPDLALRVARQESNFNPQAVSPKGAKGVMQLMDGTARDMGVQNVFDPVENITGGVKYLKALSQRFGDEEKVRAAYNAGPERVAKGGALPLETQDFLTKTAPSRGSQIVAERRRPKPVFPLNPETPAVELKPVDFDPFAAPAEKKETGVTEAAARGVTHGVFGLAEAVNLGLQFIGNRAGSQAVAERGESGAQYWAEKAKPFEAPAEIRGSIVENPELLAKGTWWAYNLADTIPSLAASIIPGVGAAKAISVAGKAVALTEKVIERLAIAGGALVGGAAGGSLEGAQTYKEVLSRGGAEPEAAVAGSTMALASGVLNALSVGKLITPTKAGALHRFLTTGATEALTEWAEEPAEGAILSRTTVAKPEDDPAKRAIEGVNVIPIAAVLGGGAGVLAGRQNAPPGEPAATPDASATPPLAPTSSAPPAPPAAPIEPEALQFPGAPTYTPLTRPIPQAQPNPLASPGSEIPAAVAPDTVEQAKIDAQALQTGAVIDDPDRVRNATLLSVYGDTPAVRAAIEGGMGGIADAMLRVAPMVEQARKSIRKGDEARDISTDIISAVDELAKIRADGRTVAQVMAQGHPEELSFEAQQLMQFLDENLDNSARIAQFLENYLQIVQDMGGVPSTVRGQAFDIIQERQAKRREQEVLKAEEAKAKAFAAAEQAAAKRKRVEERKAREQAQEERVAKDTAVAAAAGSGINPGAQTAMELAFANAKKLKEKPRAKPSTQGAGAVPEGTGRAAQTKPRPSERQPAASAEVPVRAEARPAREQKPVRQKGGDEGARANRGQQIAVEREAAARVKAENERTQVALRNPDIQTTVRGMRSQIGRDEVGGRLIVHNQNTAPGVGDVVGLTKHLGHRLWFDRPDPNMSAGQARRAVDKALAGQPLGTREQRFVNYLVERALAEEAEALQVVADENSIVEQIGSDWSRMTEEQKDVELDAIFGPETAPAREGAAGERAQGNAPAGEAEARPELSLATESESERRARESAVPAAEQRAIADRERGAFSLQSPAGSVTPNPLNEAANQRGLPDLNDITRLSTDGALSDVPESVRVNALARLKKIEAALDAGRISDGMYRLEVQGVIQDIEAQNEARKLRALKERERGVDWIRERLIRARRMGDLETDAVDFALWALEQNPALADDLAISLRASKDDGASGTYNKLARMVTLFKGSNNPDTSVHEIMHHSERMMPREVQVGILRAWQRAWAAAHKAADAKVRALLQDMMHANLGDRAAHQRVMDAFDNGTLDYATHYQLYNPSEFWAVNATDILSGRYNASGSWVARARQWLKEMIEYVKGAFGMQSNAAILRGLEAVLNGDGKFLTDKLITELAGARPSELQSLQDGAEKEARMLMFEHDWKTVAEARSWMTDDRSHGDEAMMEAANEIWEARGREAYDGSQDVLSYVMGTIQRARAIQREMDGDELNNIERTRQQRSAALSQRIVDRVDHALNPLGNLPEQQQYLVSRYEAQGMVAKANEVAVGIREAFAKADPTQSQRIFDYLTTEGASSRNIADPFRAKAEEVKARINAIGDELVEKGLLNAESREQYRDAYLPRLYLKYLLSEQDWKALGTGKKPGDMGYLKARKDIPEDVRKVILGEVTEPGFLSAVAVAKPMRDMALLDWLGQISENQSWILPGSLVEFTSPLTGKTQRVTPYWLKSEATRLRKQAHYYAPEDATKARAEATRMDEVADEALGDMEGAATDFKQIPNTARYGRLRGMFVRPEIYNDLMGVNDFLPTDPGWFQNVFGYGGVGTRATQLWKTMKVAMNPPAQVRNFVSNAVLLQLSGVPLRLVPVRVIQAAREIMSNGEHYQVAKRYGVSESTFTTQELYRMKRELLDLELKTRGLGPLGRIHRIASIVMNKAGDWYQFSETLFKTAKIIDAMERRKLSPQNAALEAQKWLFDYSLVQKSVRYARSAPVGIPFLVFQTKVLPRLIEVALLHPQRFIPWVALFHGFPMMVAAMLGVDADDLDKLKKAMPQWLQDKGHALILPIKDEQGRWQVVDLGYFMPWMMYGELASNVASGDLGKATKTAGIFSGPVTDIIVAIKTGKDPFTGRDIYQKGDPPERQLVSMMNYVWSMAAPPFLTDRGLLSPTGLLDQAYGGRAVQALTGTTNKFGEPRSTGEQALLYLAGINLQALTPEYTRATNLQVMQRELQDVKRQMNQKLQDRSLTDEQRRRIANEYAQELVRRVGKLQKYVKESAIAPELATR